MDNEMHSLELNQIWELTKLPSGKRALQNKWAYKLKKEHDGSKLYKAIFVVKSF
ncbi:Retrovirus-related Pol polyprotein from transposon TNT 1-94 [Dendrobium catenatum]|uniref:Retrovirus-related Pol polyprotein from transposon TNT 1-94 n=1 Tax=Dendrobium catenatum TaxID=906689 RepID=A0A2I0WR30_9ASPA|nr:Retrovirus-related Pol polyprotein from transposon TNT 1-94 [Dendrobium catenatum]